MPFRLDVDKFFLACTRALHAHGLRILQNCETSRHVCKRTGTCKTRHKIASQIHATAFYKENMKDFLHCQIRSRHTLGRGFLFLNLPAERPAAAHICQKISKLENLRSNLSSILSIKTCVSASKYPTWGRTVQEQFCSETCRGGEGGPVPVQFKFELFLLVFGKGGGVRRRLMEDGEASSSSVQVRASFFLYPTWGELFRKSFVRIHAEVKGRGRPVRVQFKFEFFPFPPGRGGGVRFQLGRRHVKIEDGKASSCSVKFQLFFVPHVGGTAQEQFRNSFVRIHAEVEEGEGSSSLVQVRVLLFFWRGVEFASASFGDR